MYKFGTTKRFDKAGFKALQKAWLSDRRTKKSHSHIGRKW